MSTSVRPWGKAALVGAGSVSALVLGIGMRWRETVVDIVERRPNPDYELFEYRRCVITANALQILQDVGLTAGSLEREGHLRPAKMWRFLTDDGLDVIREGSSYPGAAPAEATYHIPLGALQRALRREFVRFGGTIHWGCRAGAPFTMEDGSGFWGIQKEYGALNEIECIVNAASSHVDVAHHLFGQETWDARPKIRFPMSTGWCLASEFPEPGLSACFPPSNDVDFVVVLGKRCALHMYKTHPLHLPLDAPRLPSTDIISWRLTSQPRGDSSNNESVMSNLHPSLRQMFQKSKNVVHDEVSIPTGSCALQESAFSSRATMLGNCLLPVDLAELRGDSALIALEESASLVRKMYSQQYYRGFVPNDFREHEMSSIARRTKLCQRDLQDAEMFLSAAEQIAEGKAQMNRQLQQNENTGNTATDDDGDAEKKKKNDEAGAKSA